MSFLKHLPPAWKRIKGDRQRVHNAILSAIDAELKDAEREAIESKLMVKLESATGEWLDRFGEIFGVYRKDGEEDNAYRERIIQYVTLERGTIPAIIAAIRAFLDDYDCYIEVYEPYKNVFTLNKSKLNGYDKLLGYYYTVAVIDVRIGRNFPPQEILDLIYAFKPAGVTVHLTYTPSFDPSAAVVDVPMADAKVYRSYTVIHSDNGALDMVRGHLNLTNRTREEGSPGDLFRLNVSKLNSLDRLTGSLTAFRGIINLATFSTEDLMFEDSTTLSDVLGQTEEMAIDFYTQTKHIDDLYAIKQMDSTGYMYFTLDAGTYLNTFYSAQLAKVEPEGFYDKSTFLKLMEFPSIHYAMRATVSPSSPVPFDVQILNIEEGTWDTIQSGDLRFDLNRDNVFLDDVSPYLTTGGLVFTRVYLQGGDRDYDLYLHFYEMGFRKNLGFKLNLDVSFIQEVSNITVEDGTGIIKSENGFTFLNAKPHVMSKESMQFFIKMSPEMIDEYEVEQLSVTNETTVTEIDDDESE